MRIGRGAAYAVDDDVAGLWDRLDLVRLLPAVVRFKDVIYIADAKGS